MDFLRLNAKPQQHEYREWLTWEFPVRKMTEARIELQWEELAIGWDIKVPNGNELYMTKLRQELRGGAGFDWRGWDSAAQFTLQANANLEEGLQWSDMAIGKPNTGVENFNTLSTHYALLDRLKRTEEAKKALDKMVHAPGASPVEIHGFARQMQTQGRNDIAIIVFKANGERFPNAWPVNVGLGRAVALEGDNKRALEYFQKAAAQAPDELNRKNLQGFIKTLSEGGSIAQ
jgi:tetratricopeptide (TPR) repeat protein